MGTPGTGPGGSGPRGKWIIAVILMLLLAGTATLQIALVQMHPVSHGSTSWSSDTSSKCQQLSATDPIVRCSEFAFAPGATVGIGFSVRNNSALPMTVVSVASVGTESPAMLAQLDPVLPLIGTVFAIDRTRPFTPIELRAGEDATIYLIGRIRACDAVRGTSRPGTGVRFTVARVTVRWLLLTTEVELPLRDQLQVDAPAEGQCP
jgi:hypothetical protein